MGSPRPAFRSDRSHGPRLTAPRPSGSLRAAGSHSQGQARGLTPTQTLNGGPTRVRLPALCAAHFRPPAPPGVARAPLPGLRCADGRLPAHGAARRQRALRVASPRRAPGRAGRPGQLVPPAPLAGRAVAPGGAAVRRGGHRAARRSAPALPPGAALLPQRGAAVHPGSSAGGAGGRAGRATPCWSPWPRPRCSPARCSWPTSSPTGPASGDGARRPPSTRPAGWRCHRASPGGRRTASSPRPRVGVWATTPPAWR